MAQRMPSVARCSVVFSGNEEDIAADLKADIVTSDPWQLDLNYKGRIDFRYSTPRVPPLSSRLSLPGPGFVYEFTEEAAHFLSHIHAWPWALRGILDHAVPPFMVSDWCGVRRSYVPHFAANSRCIGGLFPRIRREADEEIPPPWNFVFIDVVVGDPHDIGHVVRRLFKWPFSMRPDITLVVHFGLCQPEIHRGRQGGRGIFLLGIGIGVADVVAELLWSSCAIG
jgi:hypothetical protein